MPAPVKPVSVAPTENVKFPENKRAVGWIQFTKPMEIYPGVMATHLEVGVELRHANGKILPPPIYRDAATQEMVFDRGDNEWRVPLASGLIGPYGFTKAVAGK